MNKKNLVLQISNHPIVELLKKDRTISNKTIARLIVEELKDRFEGKDGEEFEQLSLPFGSDVENADTSSAEPKPPPKSSSGFESESESSEEESTALPAIPKEALQKYKNTQLFKAMQNEEDQKAVLYLLHFYANPSLNENENRLLNDQERKVIMPVLARIQKVDEKMVEQLLTIVSRNPQLVVQAFKEISGVSSEPSSKAAEDPEPPPVPSSEPTQEPAEEPESQPTQEPSEEPSDEGTNNPEVFDPEAEDLETLIATSKTLIDEFYDKEFLKDQGILINDVLKQLAKIVEKEEQERAAKRSKKPKQATQELQEQDEVPFNKKERRNIQIDLKSFLRLIKKAKAVLKKFDDLRKKGSIASSGYKKDFIKILVQLQGNIKTLVEDLTPYMNLTEAVEKSDLQKKWDAIEVGYEEATKYLSNIIQAGTETQENFDMENNVKGAYGALMSITGYFPSVNPFGAKTTSGFDEYESKFSEAVDEVKGTIRDILEVTKGTIGRAATSNVIQGLKTFSGQIQNIFGEEARSTFSDVVIKPNAPAAQGDTKEIPVIEPFANRGILKLPPPGKLTPGQEEVLKDIEYSEEYTKIVNRAAEVFVGVDSVPTEPDQIKKAAEEVKDLKRDMEEMTEMSNAFGFEPEEMRAMVGLKRFLEKELRKIYENQEPRDILEVPSEISEKIAEYGKMLQKAGEGSYEVFIKALKKAAELSEPQKNKFYKFLGIPTKLEQTLNSEIKSLKEKFSDQEKEYIAAYAAAIFEFLKKKDKIGNKNKPSYKSDSLRRIIYSSSLQETEATATGKLGLTPEDHKQIQELIPEKEKRWLKQYKGKTTINNQFQYHKEEFGKLLLLMLDKKIFEYFKKEDSPQPSPAAKGGNDEPDETKTYGGKIPVKQSVDDSEVDSDDLGTFVIEKASEFEDEDLSDVEKVKSIITAASEEFPLSNITDEDIEEIQQAFADKDDSFKNQSLFAKLKDLITNDEYIKKLELAKAREVKDGILEAQTIVDIKILDKKLTALSRSPLRMKIANLFGKKFVDLSNKYLRHSLRNNRRNREILNYIAYGNESPAGIDGYEEVTSEAGKQLKKFKKANTQEQLANKLKPLIKEMLTKGK